MILEQALSQPDILSPRLDRLVARFPISRRRISRAVLASEVMISAAAGFWLAWPTVVRSAQSPLALTIDLLCTAGALAWLRFDFHRDPAYLRTRAQTLRALGLSADARYVLYAASFVGLAPDEPLLVRGLAELMQRIPRLRDLSLVVRIHPLETRERWRMVTDVFPNVVVQTAWETPPDPDGWTLATPDDQARLVSALSHAEMCVNVASTMTLDAALLDRPVIGIDFSTEADAPRGIMYDEYGVEHYRPLVERGGLRVAKSWKELAELMERAITDPSRDRLQRAQMVEHECGRADGCAAERLTAALLGAAGHTTLPAGLEHAVAGTATTWQ